MAKLIERILNGLRLTDEDDELEEDFETKPEPERPVKKRGSGQGEQFKEI